MTQEEKAKAYDEALERAREYWETDNDNTLDIKAKGTMEYLFPELKESEDEKIMKRIYNYINVTLDDNESPEKEKWLAWLEKQGDVNALIQEAAKKSYAEGMRIERKRWIEKQGEQNPEWSEEDEKTKSTIIKEGDLKPSERNWLKSLKDRITCKPSEVQMKALHN